MKKFYFKLIGDVYAMSCYAENKQGVAEYIKRMLGVNRLPKGTEIW